jgi:diaminopimelate epimerase
VRSRDSAGVAFVKGHGTQNDFVLLPDAAVRWS